MRKPPIRRYKKVQVINVQVNEDGDLFVPHCSTEYRVDMQERLPAARIPEKDYVATYRVCVPSRATGKVDGSGFYHHKGSEDSSYVSLNDIEPGSHVRRTVRLKRRKK